MTKKFLSNALGIPKVTCNLVPPFSINQAEMLLPLSLNDDVKEGKTGIR
jgi:hypothetical protein